MLTDTIINPLEGATMTRFCPKCQAETERNKKGDCKPCDKRRKSAKYAENPQKVKDRVFAWRALNPDKTKATKAAWQKSNLEKSNASKARWALENPEKVKAATLAWAKANPKANRIRQQNRRALKGVNGGKLSKGLAEKLFKLQKGKCLCCKQPLGESYHLDHIVPLALGGSNTDDNIQLLRQQCNLQKSAKHPIDFMQQRGFLL
jgi:5-methylcytosine-specific restriction endonuclease McrA